MNSSFRNLAFLAPLIAFAAPAGAGQGGSVSPVRQFASDFSGADPAILSKVNAYIAEPPADIDEIGFYGMENTAAATRIYLATVSLLDERGYLYSFEDKYLGDLFAIWIEDGVLDPKDLPPEATGVFRPFLDQTFVDDIYDEDVEASPTLAGYVAYADAHYGEATRQLEQAIEQSSGKTLLSIDATSGDTMFFALAPREIADKWLNTTFTDDNGYIAGIREPMWDSFWHKMVYALQLPTVGDTYTRPLPEGTRERRALLPPAQ